MAKKLVWQHKFHALSAKLGFRWLPLATAQTLIADGAAQRTEIGAHKFKYLDRTPLPPAVYVPHPADPGTPAVGISGSGNVVSEAILVQPTKTGSDVSIYDADANAPSLAAGDKLYYDGRLLTSNFVVDGWNAGQNEIHALMTFSDAERALGDHYYQVQTAAGLWTNPVKITYNIKNPTDPYPP